MQQKIHNVLFLCTANSARSILAEALLNHLGQGRFRAFSAGSQPLGRVNPLALELLKDSGLDATAARSKDWEEFAVPGAPHMDMIVTVCDAAAGETCPAWPGQPLTAHWSIPDPAAVQGDDHSKRHAFKTAYLDLEARVRLLVNLPMDKLERLALKEHVDGIGRHA